MGLTFASGLSLTKTELPAINSRFFKKPFQSFFWHLESWNLKRYIYTSVKSNNISISIGRYQHFLTFSYFLDYQSITKVREKKGCSLVQLKGQRAKNANVGKYFTIILEFSNQWLTFKRSTFPTSEITFPLYL